MQSLSFVRSTARVAVALMLGASSLAAQALPTASQVIDKHVTAIGGRAGFEKLTSIKQIAQMEIPAVGITADAEISMGTPFKMAMRVNIPQIGEMITGTDGEHAWSVNAMQGPRLMAGKELQQTREQADFLGGMLFVADRFSTMTNEGIVDFNGEKAYKIKMVRKDSGNESWHYFSVASGLNIGSESATTTEMGTTQVSTLIKDYKVFGGLKFPTRSEANMGPQTIVLTVKDVQLNAVAADAFAVPAAIQPLIKK
ncbi:MAG: hypothetical protein IBJ03_03555 [Gemmatimonadaceae bacterium]|nr:hypothetical protein [Gemmatimonadaceae bacterium]